MAHLTNYTRTAIAGVLSHNGRAPEDDVERKNENIDPTRTPLNYVVHRNGNVYGSEHMKSARDGLRKAIFKRIKQTDEARKSKGRAKLRKDAAVVGSWVVPLPADWPEDVEEQDFFKGVIAFMLDRYGWGLTYGFVHMDESHPHMHVPIVPLDENGCINKQVVFNRADLRTFHDDLQEYMDEHLGFHVSVLLDDDQKVEKAKSKLTQDELDALNKDIKAEVDKQVASERAEMRSKASELKQWEEDLQNGETDLKWRLKNFETQAEDVTSRRLMAEALERANAEQRGTIVRDARKLQGEKQAFKEEKRAFREEKIDLDKQEADVKNDVGFLAALKNEVLALLKELRDALVEQRTLSQSRLDEIEERFNEIEQQTSGVVVRAPDDEDEYSEDENTVAF